MIKTIKKIRVGHYYQANVWSPLIGRECLTDQASTSCCWRRSGSRSGRPTSSRGLVPGSTQRSRRHTTRTSGAPAGPRPPRWTQTAVAAEDTHGRSDRIISTSSFCCVSPLSNVKHALQRDTESCHVVKSCTSPRRQTQKTNGQVDVLSWWTASCSGWGRASAGQEGESHIKIKNGIKKY